jgi:predicted small secreted protein
MTKVSRAMVLCACAAMLVSCNTTEGIDKDVQAGGEAIEKGAKTVKKKL